MKALSKLMTEITKLTLDIETNYPELYRTLGENPVTIPNEKHPHIDNEIMEDYLESLKLLLQSHIETHQERKIDTIEDN